MPTLDLGIVAQPHRLIKWMRTSAPLEDLGAIAVYPRLRLLQTQHIITTLGNELTRDLDLAAHGIKRHHVALQVPQR